MKKQLPRWIKSGFNRRDRSVHDLSWWFEVSQYWHTTNHRGTSMRAFKLSCGHRAWLYWNISSPRKRRQCDDCRSMHASVRYRKHLLVQERSEGKPLTENPDIVDALVCKCGRCTGAK